MRKVFLPSFATATVATYATVNAKREAYNVAGVAGVAVA